MSLDRLCLYVESQLVHLGSSIGSKNVELVNRVILVHDEAIKKCYVAQLEPCYLIAVTSSKCQDHKLAISNHYNCK